MTPALRPILAIAFACLTAFGLGAVGVAQDEWFGSGDLVPYGIYCIPFGIGVWGAASFWFGLTRQWSVWVAVPLGFLAGVVLGLVATFSVALFLGPWFGAMSVPVLKSWCVAAAFAIPAIYLFMKFGLGARAVTSAVLLASLGVLLFFGISPAWSLATGNQHLTTAFFRHIPGDSELSIEDEPLWLTDDDRKLLSRSGLRGTLMCVGGGGSNTTGWPKAKALVVFTEEPTEQIRLRQPKHSTIVYVQRNEEFVMLPERAETFDRSIELVRQQNGWFYYVEHASGARSGSRLSL